MRTRIKVRAIKVVSCSGKKLVRLAFAVAFFMFAGGACFADNVDKIDEIVYNDTCASQLEICKTLVEECISAELVNKKTMRNYKRILRAPSITKYMELIEGIIRHEMFADTVGEGDTWFDYCDFVLYPYRATRVIKITPNK